MRIGILGTRGIPNYHGGFEQFAEFFAGYLVEAGHEVFVYCSKNHPYQETTYDGAHLIHCKDPEDKMGTIGQFFYDLNCILDARKRNFDVLLQLGYTSNSIWYWLLPKSPVIATNMDGLEWKRSKYNKWVRKFLKVAERLAVKSSDHLIADSKGIQSYLQQTYGRPSKYIAYGAELFENPNLDVLQKYGVEEGGYNMLIARMEPENNIEVILDGVAESNVNTIFLVVGKNDANTFGRYLTQKYKNVSHIRFLGGVYDLNALNNLRYFSKLYFHGHSVGGTNPSLLEAMASNCLIVAHKNEFNAAILDDDALYFSTKEEVKKLVEEVDSKSNFQNLLNHNKNKIQELFSWEHINAQYLEFLTSIYEQA